MNLAGGLSRRARLLLHAGMRRLPSVPEVLSPTGPLAEPPPGSTLTPVLGDYGYPLVGWTLNWMYAGPLAWNTTSRERYGRMTWSGMFGRRVLTVADPDAIGQILGNADGHWSSEEGWGWIIGPFFDGGIMLMDDPEHHRDRRVMAQAFTRRRLEGYLDRLAPVTVRAIDAWRPGTMRAYPVLKQLTLDVATEVFLGEGLEDRQQQAGAASREAVNTAFIDCVRAGTGLVRADLPLTRWSRGLAGRSLLEDHIRSKLPAHRAGDGDDLLSALCHARTEQGETFTDDAVVAHMIFLMMAAHDTSTITTNAVLYFLMRHPDWQERCAAESLAMPGDTVAFADLGQLTSLDLVIKESLRLIPPVPAMGRMTLVDTEVGGRFIPKGTAALLAPLPIHHDPAFWKDPDRFDPERFSPERREDKVHQHAYLPFGGGAHLCIGMHFGTMEVKTILHQVLRRFQADPAPGAGDDISATWDWTSLPKPLDDLPVVLRRR